MQFSGFAMKHSKLFSGLVAVLMLTSLAAVFWCRDPSAPPPPDSPAVLARVGERTITVADLRAELQRAEHLKTLDPGQVLDRLIDRELRLAKAREMHYDETAKYRRSCENLLIGMVNKRVLSPKLDAVVVSDEEVEDYYQEHAEEFVRPARRRFAVIHVPVDRQRADDRRVQEARQRIETAREKAVELADEIPVEDGFGSLAVTCSEDQVTRYKGGDIGWHAVGGPPSRWEEAIMRAGFALDEPGQVSEVVEIDKGFAILRLTSRRESVLTPLEQAASRIRQRLLRQKREEIRQGFQQALRGQFAVQRVADALEAVLDPLPKSPAAERPPSVP